MISHNWEQHKYIHPAHLKDSERRVELDSTTISIATVVFETRGAYPKKDPHSFAGSLNKNPWDISTSTNFNVP